MSANGKGALIGYWILTALIVVTQGASGVGDFLQAGPVLEGITALGFPPYFLYILGFWKLAGVVALAVPGMKTLKEWAYAGFFFDFTGALASHAMNGDGPELLIPAIIATAVLIGSYMLRPADRRLP